MQKWVILIIIVFILIATIVIAVNTNVESEYLPETEIEDEELRKSEIALFFTDITNNELKKEIRLIDSKELLKKPYETLMKLLILGPEDENLEKVIPENTEIINVSEKNGVLTITLSKGFNECCNDENTKNLVISSINKTLTQFKEISSVEVIVENN